MGDLTLEELTVEIKAFHGNRTSFDDRLPSIINLAQTRIGRLSKWEELNKTVSDTLSSTGTLSEDKVYALPSNLRTIHAIKVYDGTGDRYRKLVAKTSKQFDKYLPRPERYARGLPEIYHRWGDNIELWKIPDEDYNIDVRFAAYPATLTTGNTSDLSQKDDALIMLTVSWMYLSLKRREEANTYWLVYKNIMTEALGEDRETPDIQFGPTVGESLPMGQYWKDPFISRNP